MSLLLCIQMFFLRVYYFLKSCSGKRVPGFTKTKYRKDCALPFRLPSQEFEHNMGVNIGTGLPLFAFPLCHFVVVFCLLRFFFLYVARLSAKLHTAQLIDTSKTRLNSLLFCLIGCFLLFFWIGFH